MFKKVCLFVLLSTVVIFAELPFKKQTELKLYVTAANAFQWWQKSSETIHIIDVRTPAEYIFVGHAPMARNIPFKFLGHVYENNKPVMPINEHFVQDIQKHYAESDTLILYCRSGGRSAAATNLLAQAGFKNVYSVTDGFEGDALKDENSYHHGKRILNGWKNSGAPWTFKLNPQFVY